MHGAPPPAPASDIGTRLAGPLRRARWSLFAERLWRALAWPVGVVLAFVAAAWLGLIEAMGEPGRIAVLAVAALAGIAALVPLGRLRLPGRTDALTRIEAETALADRPLHVLDDTLAEDDDAARALWDANRRRIADTLPPLRAGLPHPDLGRRDRYFLRPALAILLFLGWFAADGRHLDRLRTALAGPPPPAPVEARLDAWVTPPAYTGRTALMLSGDRTVAPDADGTYSVPEGSILTVRAARSDTTARLPEALLATLAGTARRIDPKAGGTATAREFEATLTEDAAIAVADRQPPLAWRFRVIADRPPDVTVLNAPKVMATGAFSLAYDLGDDYGIAGAHARLAVADQPLSASAAGRPLIAPPDFALTLPAGRTHIGAAQTIRDLTSHPWAGAKVWVTLEATDDAGRTGRADPFSFTLPVKPLRHPLARAIMEQRRSLALDAGATGPVRDALDALMIAPERYTANAGHYFGLRMIDRAVKDARSDDDLRAVLDLMWTVARQIEDGNLSEAERALREAQENLRKAIENGASEQEIARLTDELRKAMDRFLQEMAENARRNPQASRPADPNAKMMSRQDLDRMLKRIEDLARTGSREAAQELLNQLQQMMENLQAGRPQQRNGAEGADGQTSEMLDKLGELLRRQQELLDNTQKADPRGQRQKTPGGGGKAAPKPLSPQELTDLLKRLEEQQAGNRQALKELLDKLGENGLGEDGEGGDSGPADKLGKAGEAMGRAGEALGRGRAGEAVGPEGEALDALRQGAQGLMKELGQRQQGRGKGQGNDPGGDQAGGRDPLGRERQSEGPDFSDAVKVPGEIDAERARRILEDIRGRLSQPARPQRELDYLDRLLKAE